MFFGNIFEDPNYNACVVPGSVCNNLSEMVVIRLFQLILDYDLSARAFFFCKDIDAIFADSRFLLRQPNRYADLVAELGEVFLVGEPIRKIVLLAFPNGQKKELGSGLYTLSFLPRPARTMVTR